MITWRLDRNRLLDLRLLVGLMLPASAGAVVLGWRAVGTILLVISGASGARWLLSHLIHWPVRISASGVATQALLLAMFVPATWFDLDLQPVRSTATWPLAMATGAMLVLIMYVIARLGSARFSALVITVLLLNILLPDRFVIDRVLPPASALLGDILSPETAARSTATAEPWIEIEAGPKTLVTPSATRRLDDYIHSHLATDQPATTLARLVTDDLPPLEDLVVMGHPRAIGLASAIAALMGGLFLVHRKIVAFRLPVLMLGTATIVLWVAPTPILIGETGTITRWLPAIDPRVGWAVAATYVNYLLLASPTLLVTFFIACWPGVRPLGLRAGIVYALLFGVLCGVLISTISVALGPLIAVAIAQLVAPTLDRHLPPKALTGG